ncbi:MarR family winged helix-turn-helix transcriptional regulator [Nocardia arthritidis]|uniref:MarR family transcriptional regulator n=1 Tax=Nocardia arthritidis TaxID=228602 RepID=A0A6G9YAJ9_9NOCA|nr:MarR family winged helix-turn-helix transcriptional regulator [Nocardia arthritidis]QIS10241.1 MarR family transcriptional regulator [Nocardia arthritidis]
MGNAPKLDGRVAESAVRAANDVRTVFSRLRRRFRELAVDDDLTPSQTAVLSRLEKDGPASTSDLAAAERVRPQSMAMTVSALVGYGYVERRPDPADGRRQLLSLTETGRVKALGDRAARQEWLSHTLHERFTEAQRRTIIEAMALLDEVAQS